MRYILLVLTCFLLCGFQASAQEQDKERVNSRGFMIAVMSSNRGLGVETYYLMGSGKLQWVFGLDGYYVRSLHEVKVEPYPFPDRKYVYGKLNNFWIISPVAGIQYRLAAPSSYNMVDMRGGVKIGPAFGILNPYYIKLCGLSGTCESRPFDPNVHSYQAISGRSSIFSSEFNPQFRLGLSLKTFAILDFNNKSRPITGIKVGLNADLFPSDIPIMLDNEDLNNPSSFFAANIGFILGGNW